MGAHKQQTYFAILDFTLLHSSNFVVQATNHKRSQRMSLFFIQNFFFFRVLFCLVFIFNRLCVFCFCDHALHECSAAQILFQIFSSAVNNVRRRILYTTLSNRNNDRNISFASVFFSLKRENFSHLYLTHPCMCLLCIGGCSLFFERFSVVADYSGPIHSIRVDVTMHSFEFRFFFYVF